MDRPDVVVMTFDLAPSGVVTNALRIAGAAQRSGFKAELWTVQDFGASHAALPAGVPVRSFGETIGEGYSRQDRRAAARQSADRLAAALKERAPRVSLSAGNHFHELAAEAAKLARPSWDGRLIGRVSNDLPRFSWSPHRIPWSLYKRLSARRRLSAMDRLVAVSHSLGRDLVRELLIDRTKISVIPNGIDSADVARRGAETIEHPWFAEGQPPVVLGAGRLVRQKNFEALIAAFAEARKSMPMRLMLLGEGSERNRLEAQVHSLGLSDDVSFQGFVPNPIPYFRQAQLFVLPSRWEGMSNALLEALAAGCPSLATRCAGSAELLGNALSSQIVPVGDVHALASAILRDLRDPPDRQRFRNRASDYDLGRTLQSYDSMIGAEVAQSGGRSGD